MRFPQTIGLLKLMTHLDDCDLTRCFFQALSAARQILSCRLCAGLLGHRFCTSGDGGRRGSATAARGLRFGLASGWPLGSRRRGVLRLCYKDERVHCGFEAAAASIGPRSSLLVAVYQSFIEAYFGWVEKLLMEFGGRVVPIWGMDLNDQVCYARDPHGHWVRSSFEGIGEYGLGREHSAARRFRQTMLDHHLALASSFVPVAYSFCGTDGQRSKIDSLAHADGCDGGQG